MILKFDDFIFPHRKCIEIVLKQFVLVLPISLFPVLGCLHTHRRYRLRITKLKNNNFFYTYTQFMTFNFN